MTAANNLPSVSYPSSPDSRWVLELTPARPEAGIERELWVLLSWEEEDGRRILKRVFEQPVAGPTDPADLQRAIAEITGDDEAAAVMVDAFRRGLPDYFTT